MLYKKIKDCLVEAQEWVATPSEFIEEKARPKNKDGWYYFETLSAAYEFFGILEPNYSSKLEEKANT